MNEHVIDGLGGSEARTLEAGLMLPKEGPLAEERLQEVRAAVARYVKPRGYSQELIAAKVGSNPTYVSCFLAGKFADVPAGSLQKLARRLNAWIELDNQRRRNERGQVFVHTTVAERIIKVCKYAAETGDIVVLHGPAGIGKSCTLVEVAKLIPATIYLLATTDHARRSGFLRGLREVVWEVRAPSRPTLTDIIDRLAHSDRLLIVHNADVLETSVFRTLMDLHDAAGIPIVLAGTHKLVEKLAHDADPLRGQMSSRIEMRAEILGDRQVPKRGGPGRAWVTAAQIREILARGRIKLHPAAVERLKAIANFQIGHLRRCGRMVRYAALYSPGARNGDGPLTITLEMLERAIALVDGQEAAAAPVSADSAETVEAVG